MSADADRLAMFGGTPVLPKGSVDAARIRWPVVTELEHEAIRRVLEGGPFTSNDGGKGPVSALQEDWARYVGTAHCAAVSNGTAALELALAALELEPGDEVLVPALTFVGSAVPIVSRGLVPRFVDVDPRTYNIDPVAAEKAVTARTRAVIAVHLHGLPCEMTELGRLADRHDLSIIEDAAQAHGARYRGARVGSLGRVNAVSLNVVKNLPTCGEGGLVTSDDREIIERVVLLRQFGEDLRPGRARDYLSRVVAGNHKMSAVQAAFTRAQLGVLDEYSEARDRTVRSLLDRLAGLPGLWVPACPDDRTHVWHILRFRLDPDGADAAPVGAGALRAIVQRALRAEGVPVQPYQVRPVPGQQAFASLPDAQGVEDFPEALAAIDETFTLQRWHLNPASAPILDRFAEAFAKVWHHLPHLASIAASGPHRPPWSPSPRGRR